LVNSIFFNLFKEILKWDSKEAQEVFWHSSSHILGQAVEWAYENSLLCKGPPLPDEEHSKFFYDSYMNEL
jgi:threonyl-tRNA synthetase